MSPKVFRVLSAILLLALVGGLLAGCATPTAQIVEKTVKETVVVKETVKETVVAKETVVSVEKETVKETVVVVATPEPESLSDVQELRVLEPLAFHAAGMMAPPSERAGGVSGLLWLQLVGSDTDALPVPTGLAESWEVNADSTSVVFKLRQDAKFSDGTPITAKEAAWSINYQIMSCHPDIYGKHDFFPVKRELITIQGVQDVCDGKITADEFGAADVEGVKVVDDTTLQIDLTQPNLFILNNLQFVRIVKPESVMAGKDKNYAEDAYWTTEPGCVYSGSYVLDSFGSGSGMSLVPNPNWFGPAPKITKINVLFVDDRTAAIAAFENKEADWMNFQLNPIDVASLQQSDYLKSSLVTFPSLSVQQLLVNPFKPMDDVHVRRAISMAIDRQALVDVLGGGAGQTTYKVIPGHFAPANKNCGEQFATVVGMPFDPAKAKEELALSPYAADLAGGMELNMQLGMFGMPMSQDLIVAQVIQKMLQDNLGIKVTIHSEPIADFNAPPFATHFWPNEQGDHFIDQMAFMNNLASWIAPLPEESKMGMISAPYIPELADAMAEAAKATEITAHCEALAKAQQIWQDQVYTIDLFTLDYSMLIAPWVQGYQIANFGGTVMLQPGLENVVILKH